MTGRLPLIVVTLPGRTVADVLRQAETARAAGGDLAEVRLDLWTPEDRASLRGLFPAPLPLVATLRSRAEGGGGPDAPAERATELIAAAACPFRWLDLEADRDGALLGHLPPTTSLGRILSTHLPAGAGASALAERIREGSEARSIRKVVTPATVGILLKEILPLLSRDAGNSCVVLTTGPSGGLLRAWSARLGFPLVYASLPSPRGPSDPDLIEPSQIPVDRLRPFFEGGTDAPIFAVLGRPFAQPLPPLAMDALPSSVGALPLARHRHRVGVRGVAEPPRRRRVPRTERHAPVEERRARGRDPSRTRRAPVRRGQLPYVSGRGGGGREHRPRGRAPPSRGVSAVSRMGRPGAGGRRRRGRGGSHARSGGGTRSRSLRPRARRGPRRCDCPPVRSPLAPLGRCATVLARRARDARGSGRRGTVAGTGRTSGPARNAAARLGILARRRRCPGQYRTSGWHVRGRLAITGVSSGSQLRSVVGR